MQATIFDGRVKNHFNTAFLISTKKTQRATCYTLPINLVNCYTKYTISDDRKFMIIYAEIVLIKRYCDSADATSFTFV